MTRLRTFALAALGLCAGCGAATSQLASAAVGGALSAAAQPGPSHASTVHYSNKLQMAKWRFENLDAPADLVVVDAAAHVKGDAVRFVRLAGGRVEWLDECTAGAAVYGERRSLGGETPRSIEIVDEVDLFELAPALDGAFGGPVRQGKSVRVDLLTTSSRATERVFTRLDASARGCSGATHFISAVRYGALRVNVDPSPRPTERELEAQKELELGSFAACRDEGVCEQPVIVRVVPLGRARAPLQ